MCDHPSSPWRIDGCNCSYPTYWSQVSDGGMDVETVERAGHEARAALRLALEEGWRLRGSFEGDYTLEHPVTCESLEIEEANETNQDRV